MTLPTVSSIDEILDLFHACGDSQYGGECVTQLQHALQAAALAETENASPALISAALLHDVGHLLHQLPSDAPEHGIDDHHENAGDRQLRDLFPEAVTSPIRLHVAAKRYLCTVEPSYLNRLSGPSITSFHLQGGLMSPEELEEFRANRYYEAAIRLRRWDDAAKDADGVTPPLEHFAHYLRASAKQESAE